MCVRTSSIVNVPHLVNQVTITSKHRQGFTHSDLLAAVCPSEWRSGVAGHLILSDEDLTSVVQGNWKRLNTLQHYKVRGHPSLHHGSFKRVRRLRGP